MLNPLDTLVSKRMERFNVSRRQRVTGKIEEVLRSAGHRVTSLEVTADLRVARMQLEEDRPDVVFYQSVRVDPARPLSDVPALLERMRIPYTGSAPAVCRAAQDKRAAKQLFTAAGLRTPEFTVITGVKRIEAEKIPQYPLFVKPLMGGCSIGISSCNPVFDKPGLRAALRSTSRISRQPALVERFLDGREFSVGIMGNSPPAALPVMEYIFADGECFRTFSGKTVGGRHAEPVCPARLTESAQDELKALALEAARVVGCRDYARVDLRCDSRGLPHVLEVNTHPSLLPESSFPRMAAAAGYAYLELLEAILSAALARHGFTYSRGGEITARPLAT